MICIEKVMIESIGMKSIDVKLPHINKFLQFITHNNIIYVKPNANAFSYIDNNFF
jgi:hypothetical protein